jgi:BirA family biotin operon repressor/biotin-[acetyl-CoA-carboxylase] ligase
VPSSPSDSLSTKTIQDGLKTQFVGRHLVFLPETASTNDQARQLAESGAPDGTLVIAEYQTAGRGRGDRRWEAPTGTSLLMSLIFRPPLAPRQVQRLTMLCGLAITDVLEAEFALEPTLKWPNDILIGSAKVGGILTEILLDANRVECVITGIGLNVNLDPSELPGELMMEATSLSQALGRPIARLPLLWAILQRVEMRYTALMAGHSPYDEWVQRLGTLGRPVIVSSGDAVVEGVAERVNSDGALLVRLADGRLSTVVAGDVIVRSND